MRVALEREQRGYGYRIALDPDDRSEARRTFADADARMRLARTEYRVELPASFQQIHPDLHAAAIWYVLRLLIGSRLELPFAVSEPFAAAMLAEHGVEFPNTSSAQAPRTPPEQTRPCLLFSGGMDSAAASVLLPRNTQHLFLDRIPHFPEHDDPDVLIDLARQRDACDAVVDTGRDVHATRDDHEFLFEPYPAWHSNMALLSALYMADSLGVAVVDGGGGLDTWTFAGYLDETPDSWKFRPPEWLMKATEPGAEPLSVPYFAPASLQRAESIGGLSEVATTRVVSQSPLRGRSFSCYYQSDESFCMRCDKCFKKLLLRYIVEGEQVPTELFEHFYSIPRLAAIFAQPYFDWHHIWYYLFQNIRCDHWFARELNRQAQQGPDLSMLEKWYPRSAAMMAAAYRDEVIETTTRQVGAMSAAEIDAFEHLDVPPLYAPERRTSVGVGAAPNGSPPIGDLLEWVRGLLVPGSAPWPDVGVVEVSAAPGLRAIRVEMCRGAPRPPGTAPDEDRLLVEIERRRSGDQPCYADAGPLVVSYMSSTPLDVPWRQAALDELVRQVGSRVATLPD